MLLSTSNSAGRIYTDLVQTETFPHYGLMGGKSGEALFLAYLYKTSGDEDILDQLQDKLENILELYNDAPQPDYSFAYGLSGIGWLLVELERLGILDNAADLVDLADLDQLLLSSITENTTEGYDFFSGLIGKGMYWLKRPLSAHTQEGLTQIVRRLQAMAYTDAHGIYWPDPGDGTFCQNDRYVNMGLAHGMPGIINFLSMVHHKGIAVDTTTTLLREGIRWITNAGVESATAQSLQYPYFFNLNTNAHTPQQLPGRVAWCYGDIGIATTFILAGLALEDKSCYETGMRMALSTTQRKSAAACQVMDASICHGSAGIAFIYQRLHTLSAHPAFREAANHWHDCTLDMLQHTDGIGGYKYWQANTESGVEYTRSSGFLEGASGVGISLLAHEHADLAATFEWHQLLLL